MSNVPPPPPPGSVPPGGYQQPQPPPGGYQAPPPAPGGYQAPPAAPGAYQQPPPAGPPPTSSSNGCLKAALIVGGILVFLGILTVGGCVLFVGKAVDELEKTFGVADPKDYEVKFDTCEISDSGSMSATGTITNKANRRQAYHLTIDFLDDKDVKLGSDPLIYTGGLQKDAKYQFDASNFSSSDKAKITCRVGSVDYWPA